MTDIPLGQPGGGPRKGPPGAKEGLSLFVCPVCGKNLQWYVGEGFQAHRCRKCHAFIRVTVTVEFENKEDEVRSGWRPPIRTTLKAV